MDEAGKKPFALSAPLSTLGPCMPSHPGWQPPGPILAVCWLSYIACLSHGFTMEIIGCFHASLGRERGCPHGESELSMALPSALLSMIRQVCEFSSPNGPLFIVIFTTEVWAGPLSCCFSALSVSCTLLLG